MGSQAFYDRAERLRARSRFKEAVPLYLRAATAAQREQQEEDQVRGWLGAVECLRSLGEFSRAAPWAKRAVKVSRRHPALQAEALAAEGLVWRGLERYPQALRRLRQAAAAYHRLGDHHGEAYCWWGMGGCERFGGRPLQAVGYFERARRAFQRAGDGAGRDYASFGMAGAFRVLGRLHGSLALYHAAWKRRVKARDRFGEAYGLCGMAHAYRKLSGVRGQRSEEKFLKKAGECYRESGTLYRKIGDWSSVGYTSWGLGQVALARKAPGAGKCFGRAHREFQKARDTRGIALTRLALARLGEGSKRQALTWARRRGWSTASLDAY